MEKNHGKLKLKNKNWLKTKIHGNLIIIFLISPQLQRICFFLLKAQKITTFQQVTGGDKPSLALKRIQGHFL